MANEVTVKIDGLRELQTALEQLPKKLGAAALGEALTAGGSEVLKEVEVNVPRETGWLARHFNLRLGRSRNLARRATVAPDSKEILPGRSNEYQTAAMLVSRFEGLATSRRAMQRRAKAILKGQKPFPFDPFFTKSWEVSKGRALAAITATLKRVLGL